MSEPRIHASGLGKRYRIRGPSRRVVHDVWALRHLDLAVAPGEILGVVGANGAGKSTLLKLISLVSEPSEGSFSIRGRVASLLEVGVGFHWLMTGRENIYLGGTLLGMRRRDVDAKLEEIVAFADLGPYLDTPVRRYSSGMVVRLGFAVAAHLDAEILLMDEVLAVADAAFRARCLARVRQSADDGRAVLYVSHNLDTVRSLCDRAIYLERGTCRAQGTPDAVLEAYRQGAGEG